MWGAERKRASGCGVATVYLVLLLGCGGGGDTGGSADAPVADAPAAAFDGGLTDASPDAPPRRAALWTRWVPVKPECIVTLTCDMCLPLARDPVSLEAVLTVSGREMRGWHGTLHDGAVADYMVEPMFSPARVRVETGQPVEGNGGAYTPFATVTEFSFTWRLLDLWSEPQSFSRAMLEGTLDFQGLPTSLQPASESAAGMAGRLAGCLARDAADNIWLESLSQTMRQLMDSSGCQLDCASTADGGLDGYLFEIRWEAAEVVTLLEP